MFSKPETYDELPQQAVGCLTHGRCCRKRGGARGLERRRRLCDDKCWRAFCSDQFFFFLQALESLEGRGGSSVDRERGSWLPTTASVATGARESFCLALERQCIELLSVLVSFSVLQRPLRIWYLCLLGCYVIASKYLWGNFPPETWETFFECRHVRTWCLDGALS